MMSAVHRYGLRDPILGTATPFGLGVAVDFTGGAGRTPRSGTAGWRHHGIADPDCDLVMVVVCNGLPNPLAAERRMMEITDAVYTALGDDVARFRRSSGSTSVALST